MTHEELIEKANQIAINPSGNWEETRDAIVDLVEEYGHDLYQEGSDDMVDYYRTQEDTKSPSISSNAS